VVGRADGCGGGDAITGIFPFLSKYSLLLLVRYGCVVLNVFLPLVRWVGLNWGVDCTCSSQIKLIFIFIAMYVYGFC
jgi:hypothetical protein